ncbi:MAG: hypothetical protein EOO88_08940 [Pedobacter sp.]|nr:MAG: hypothetical protein EOO88_08940 [Pedobacter sp.]
MHRFFRLSIPLNNSNTIKTLFTTCLLVAVLAACQRPVDEILEPEPSPPEEPTEEEADSTLLRRLAELDQNGDSLDVTLFFYDEQKRAKEATLKSNTPENHSLRRYFYHGTDTLPYLVYSELRNAGDNDYNLFDSVWLKYEHGIVVWDSVHQDHGYMQGEKAIIVNKLVLRGDTLIHYANRKALKVNGDVEIYNDTAYYIARYEYPTWELSGILTTHSFTEKYEFNSHPNPLWPFLVKDPIQHLFVLGAVPGSQYLADVIRSSDLPPTFELVKRMSYTYRSDGYPLTSVTTDNYHPEGIKAVYIY